MVVQDGAARLDVAARVAGDADPPEAWAAVCALHGALAGAKGGDRAALCRDAWERVAAIEPARVGGSGVHLLVVASDEGGELISAVGISGLWGHDALGPRPMVPESHPLLAAPPTLPEAPPKVLGPEQPASRYLGVCAGDPPADWASTAAWSTP